MFDALIVQPIFNLLVFIYGVIPGHNFGLSIILFTVVVRLLMWPLVKKQLHQTKAMREMQPEIKRIKKAAAGNRQKESLMLMELYKERGISPFGSLGTLVVQLVILLGLYSGLSRVVNDPQAIVNNAYGFIQNLPWLQTVANDIGRFDDTLFGLVNLSRPALNQGGGFYIPALIIVLASAVAQYYQTKQLMPNNKDGRSLRTILREANDGKKADQSEVNAAVGQMTRYILPAFIVLFTLGIASALSLYWLVSGLVAYIQQARVLNQDEQEMEAIADAPSGKTVIEGEVIETKKPKAKKKPAKKTNKRRK